MQNILDYLTKLKDAVPHWASHLIIVLIACAAVVFAICSCGQTKVTTRIASTDQANVSVTTTVSTKNPTSVGVQVDSTLNNLKVF